MKYLIPVLVGGAAITATITTAIAQAHQVLNGNASLTSLRPYLIGYGVSAILWAVAGVMAVNASRQESKPNADAKGAVRIEVLKLLMQGYCTQEEMYEKTGATLDLLVEMQAAGELYLSSSGWIMRERPKNR